MILKRVMVLSLFFGIIDCAQESPNSVSIQEASSKENQVTNGFRCHGEQHPSAGSMLQRYGDQYRSYCTGVLIAPDVVLTAAHCLPTLEDDEVEHGFTFDDRVDDRTVPDAVMIDYEIHPYYLDGFGSHDLGLVFLDHPLDGVYTNLLSDEESDLLNFGMPIEFVGYGITRVRNSNGGNRYCGSSRIEAIEDFTLGFGAGRPGTLEGGVCSGDSGGPSFITVERNGQTHRRMVAINSKAADGCGSALVARVDIAIDWIDSSLVEHCDTGVRTWCSTPGIPSPEDNGSMRLAPQSAEEEVPHLTDELDLAIDSFCAQLVNSCGYSSLTISECRVSFKQELFWLADEGCVDTQSAARTYYDCATNAGCSSFDLRPTCATEAYQVFMNSAESCLGDSLEDWRTKLSSLLGQANEPYDYGSLPEQLLDIGEGLCSEWIFCNLTSLEQSTCELRWATQTYQDLENVDCPQGYTTLAEYYECLVDERECSDWRPDTGAEECSPILSAAQDLFLRCQSGAPQIDEDELFTDDDEEADLTMDDSEPLEDSNEEGPEVADPDEEAAAEESGCSQSSVFSFVPLLGLFVLKRRRVVQSP